jgi:cobalt-zinc-cadmium efflux system membrane fusion protein
MFEIVNTESMILSLNVFEKDAHRLAPGQNVIAYTNIDPSRKIRCEISVVGKELSHDRTLRAYCRFKERVNGLVPGMFMNAEIEVQRSDAYALPLDALVSYENKQFVFAVRSNNDFEMIEVSTGISRDGFVEIIPSDTSMFQNTTFVSKGAYNILMKMKNTPDE